jgi:hypothetical protein
MLDLPPFFLLPEIKTNGSNPRERNSKTLANIYQDFLSKSREGKEEQQHIRK